MAWYCGLKSLLNSSTNNHHTGHCICRSAWFTKTTTSQSKSHYSPYISIWPFTCRYQLKIWNTFISYVCTGTICYIVLPCYRWRSNHWPFPLSVFIVYLTPLELAVCFQSHSCFLSGGLSVCSQQEGAPFSIRRCECQSALFSLKP